MKDCKEHRFGMWHLALYGTVYYGKEVRSCQVCGASQVRTLKTGDKETGPGSIERSDVNG